MGFDCNPHDNDQRPDECRACRDDGRPDCEECGGCEPQLTLDDALLAAQEDVAVKIAAFYRFVDSLPNSEDDDYAA